MEAEEQVATATSHLRRQVTEATIREAAMARIMEVPLATVTVAEVEDIGNKMVINSVHSI